MVLNLRTIYRSGNKSYNIIARNHRDQAMMFSGPNDIEPIHFGRWLDAGEKCTELNVTNSDGQTATIQLEDHNWRLIVSGNIKGGRKVIRVGGSHDFDIIFKDCGHMLLQCRNGEKWGDDSGNSLDFVLLPFQGKRHRRSILSVLRSLTPSSPSLVPLCCFCFFLVLFLWGGYSMILSKLSSVKDGKGMA